MKAVLSLLLGYVAITGSMSISDDAPSAEDSVYRVTIEECGSAKFVNFDGLNEATLIDIQKSMCLNLPKAIEAVDTDVERYKKWFGEYSKNRSDTVKKNFQKLYDGLTSTTLVYQKFQMLCDFAGSTAHSGGPLLKVMYTCPLLYTLSPFCAGKKEKTMEGIILREWMFAFAFTYPSGIGSDIARMKARDNPDKAVKIGDNYEYFYCNTE